MRTPLRIGMEAVGPLRQALKSPMSSDVKLRIRAIILIAKGKLVPAAAQALSLEERTVRNWIHRYLEEGIEGLKDRRTQGRMPRLRKDQMEALKRRIEAGPQAKDKVCSLRGQDIRKIIKEEFGPEYSLDGVYYLLKKELGLRYLKPRPRHHKTDPQAQEAFKKTFLTGWQR